MPVVPVRGFYAIVDPDACAGRDPVWVARAILEGGCAALQLRAKRSGPEATAALGRELAPLCRAVGVPFYVNDHPELVLALDAEGVHLGQRDLSIEAARGLLGPERAIGLSTHDLAQARDAERRGADLVGFGPVFATSTKENPDPVVGTDLLRDACRELTRPVVAIGGITPARAREVAATGATLAAAIGAVCGAENPADAAHAIHRALVGAV